MGDWLVLVSELLHRGVLGCEQRHVPDIVTLLGVTRSALRELHERTVGSEKYKWSEREQRRPARGYRTGLAFRVG